MFPSHDIKRTENPVTIGDHWKHLFLSFVFPHSQRPLSSGITWLYLKWRIPSSLIFSQQNTCLRGKTNVTFSGSLWEILTSVFLEAVLESIDNQGEHPYYTGSVHWALTKEEITHGMYVGRGVTRTYIPVPQEWGWVSKVSPLLDFIYTHSQTEVTQIIRYPSWRVDSWVKISTDEGPWDTYSL